MNTNWNLFRRLICLLAFISATHNFAAKGQIVRFNHRLSQDRIQNAGFSIHRPSSYQIRSGIKISADYGLHLYRNIVDTITTNVTITLDANDRIFVKSTLETSSVFNLNAGFPATVADNNLYDIAASGILTIPGGKTVYVYTENPNTVVNIKKTTAYDSSDAIEVKRLSTTQVSLVAPTKGVITVSSGKISFDPWRTTTMPAPAGNLLAINANTPVPLELKDGRQTISAPTKVLWVPYRHLTIGINSIPFRYRPRTILNDTVHSSGTVTTSFNLALSLGHTWGISEITTRGRIDYAFTIGLFAGPSSVDLKKETVRTPANFTAGRTNPVLSYGMNTIFSRNGLGLLLAIGFDDAFGKQGNDWIYDNKLWYGIGVSASFPR